MTKKDLNQNAKFEQELIDTFEPNFIFSEKPLNRFNSTKNNNNLEILNKAEKLFSKLIEMNPNDIKSYYRLHRMGIKDFGKKYLENQ